ncbi:MAG: hybrid-cluster NAD(P)-dependent oxidoreductase [SAR324 cluster bacterium]|nr:hybrid-cluster NAD(P)-dependent oxidoreductase [SAR324 cluster bacterium]
MPLAVADPRRLSRWQKGKILVRCVEVIDDTHDVKTFRLIANPPVLFTFKPGQFLTLELQIDGKPVHRSYTISSTPSRPHALELTVKRVAGGRVSNWLHDNLHVGDSLSVKGPGGSFSFFDHPARKMLMISGGSGITPVMSMARWVCDTVADCDVVFLHAARTAADIIFRAELEMMDRRYANFHLFVTSSQAEPDQAPSELSGRITPEMVRKVAPDFAERTVYVCGPTGFMASARNIMKSLDHPMDNFHEESFGVSATETGRGRRHTKPGAPGSVLGLIPTPVRGARLRKLVGDLDLEADAARSAAPPATPQDIVVFAQSGKEIPGDEETTILELAQEHGVHIPSACLSGVCGTCKVRKTGGEVRAEASDGLEPDDVAAGYILTCVAWAKGRVVLDA